MCPFDARECFDLLGLVKSVKSELVKTHQVCIIAHKCALSFDFAARGFRCPQVAKRPRRCGYAICTGIGVVLPFVRWNL